MAYELKRTKKCASFWATLYAVFAVHIGATVIRSARTFPNYLTTLYVQESLHFTDPEC